MLKIVVAAVCVAACSSEAETPLGETVQDVWSNGDFEQDPIGTAPPTGWTVAANLNPALTDTRPSVQTLASLNLTAGGVLMTSVVGGATETQTDPDLGTNGTVRFPKYGQRAVRVNYTSAALNGKNSNANTLKQTMTVNLGDVDPTDNKVHVRFAIAPILENPAHVYTQQPYYYVRVQNVTTGVALYQDFNAAAQAGVPWKNFTDTSGVAAQYTDWQLVDVAPGNALLAVGNQIQLTVVAAGCSPGGHWGRVYVDAVGSGIPGLYAWGTGPQQANAGSNIVYTINYKNGGTTTSSGTKLDLVTPPNTTFQAVSGATCTTPLVGGTGTISCALGSLSNGSVGAFTVTVQIPAATLNGTLITNGNYSIYATGVSALIGPKVNTTVTSSVQYADVGVTVTNGVAARAWGQPTTYTLVATNRGPVAAATVTVQDTIDAQLTAVTWTCAAAGGASCTASGSGSPSDSISLPVGATATYTIRGTTVTGSGAGSTTNTATVAVVGVTDPDTTNNSAVDTDSLGSLRTLTVAKTTGITLGTVTSVPSVITCGTGCTTASGDFLDGTQVVVTATPVAGATFTGWTGACAGTASSCTVTMTAALTANASFVGAAAASSIVTGTPQSAHTGAAFSSALAVAVVDAFGAPVPNVVVTFSAPATGATASLSAVTATTNSSGIASITATASTTPGAYTVSAQVPGIAGSLSFALTNAGDPASVAIASGSPQSTTVATPFGSSLAVVVRDSASQPVSGVVVTFTGPTTGASATFATTATTDASGLGYVIATANASAGAYAVTARVTGVAAAASFALANVASAPANLSVTMGANQSTRVTRSFGVPVIVHLVDSHDNAVAGATITFAVPTSGATAVVSATNLLTDAGGTASITATAGTVTGAYAITVTTPGVIGLTIPATNVAGPAASATLVGTPQSASVATSFATPLAVHVIDAYDNPVPNVGIVFTAPLTGATATLSSGSTTTDTSGNAQVVATATSIAGSYAVTATVAGLASFAYVLTNAPGVPDSFVVVGGASQAATVGTAFAPLAVQVRDVYDNPVSGVAISAVAPSSEPAAVLGGGGNATTNASGYASIAATAGHGVGSQYEVTGPRSHDRGLRLNR